MRLQLEALQELVRQRFEQLNKTSVALSIVGLLLGTVYLLSVWRQTSVLGLLSLKLPSDPGAQQWLEAFHRQERSRRHSPAALPAGERSVGACGDPTAEPRKRTSLVVATVGDGWTPDRWLNSPSSANFDLGVLYYGFDPNFTCTTCTFTIHIPGPKWYIYYYFTTTPTYLEVQYRGYDYIMMPDDDLELDTCIISTVFDVAKQYDLIMAQSSVCKEKGTSFTYWKLLYQDPRYRLRYVDFIEVMAPVMRMDFFDAVVRPTLKGSFVGYGLDHIWPALLGWPQDRLGVVDEVCMVHPPSPPSGKEGGLYVVAGQLTEESGAQEEQRRFQRYNFWRPLMWSRGKMWRTPSWMHRAYHAQAVHGGVGAGTLEC